MRPRRETLIVRASTSACDAGRYEGVWETAPAVEWTLTLEQVDSLGVLAFALEGWDAPQKRYEGQVWHRRRNRIL